MSFVNLFESLLAIVFFMFGRRWVHLDSQGIGSEDPSTRFTIAMVYFSFASSADEQQGRLVKEDLQ